MIVSYPIITWSSHGRRKPNRNLIVYNKKKRCWNLWAPETHTLWPTFSPPFKITKKPQPLRWYLVSRKRRRGTCRSSFTSFCLSFPTNAQPFLRGYAQEKRREKCFVCFHAGQKDKIGTLSFHVRVAWESQKPLNSSVNCHPLGWKFFPSAPNFVRWVPLCLFVELLSCLNKIWRAESRWQ